MMFLSSQSFFVLSLGLLSTVTAQDSLSPSLNALMKRETVFVNPVSSLNFSSTVPEFCKYPCKGLISMGKTCSAEATCTDKLLCSTSGLNSLVQCNNCVLQLANRTTGVSTSLYANVTTILTSTESLCKKASLTASANTTIIPLADFTPWAQTSTAQTNLTGDGITSSGVGAASESTSSASPRLVGGLAGLVVSVVGGLAVLL